MSTVKACIFCDIVAGKSPNTIIEFSNEDIVIFKDIKPASDHHYLAVPKRHMPNVRDCTINEKDLSMIPLVLFNFQFCCLMKFDLKNLTFYFVCRSSSSNAKRTT